MDRILVVDDKPEVSEPIAEGLGLYLGDDVEVDIAADGQMALAMFREKHHKGIISDGNMPRLTGPELAAIVLAESPGTLFIGMTGLKDNHDSFIKAGVLPENIIIKPIIIASVAKTFKSILGQ